MDSASNNYGLSPPPLDNLSSADGTECDYEEYDLEVNAVNSCTATSIAPKQYKSFQPSIKLQPTDLIYREEHSRAAPRKGIEPKAFLTIGETKQEHIQYVGRQKQPASSRQVRTVSAVNTRKLQQRQSTVYSAPPSNRNKSRVSRTGSGKGRYSTGGYTPLPVAPPPTIAPRENTYIHNPFKQNLSHEAFRSDPAAFEQHLLDTMDEFVASMVFNSPSKCSSATETRLPVSPGEELKNSTILATMEVGRYINQREKTPNVSSQPREPKLLKARLKPLNTVNVTGPSINDCQGVQADQRQFGPSPMKAKLQKQLDDVIKKNAALKDISTVHYGSRKGSSKVDTRRKSSAASKVKLKTPDSASSTKREPTPSPYSSITQLDKAGAIAVSSQPPDSQAKPSRVQSATHSEASHTEQQTLERSVSAVTIRHRETTTPVSHPSQPTAKPDDAKGTIFLTDADSIADSVSVSTKAVTQTHHKPPTAPKSEGCKDFQEMKSSGREDDDDKDRPTDNTLSLKGSNSTVHSKTASQQAQQQNSQGSDDQTGKQCFHQTEEFGAANATHITSSNKSLMNGFMAEKNQRPEMSAHSFTSAGSGVTSRMNANGIKTNNGKHQISKNSKEHYREPEEECTFITAGFLTLESMIKDARRMLRHSYSLNDLDVACDWDQPISSPRSVEVLNKEVTFDEVEKLHYFDSTEDNFYAFNNLAPAVYSEPKLDLVPVKEPLVDAFPCERQSSTNTQEHAKEAPTSLDSIQRELAARNSPYGIHGEISEYLTTKTLFREICPPKPSKQEATCTLHVPGPDLSCLDTDSVECVPVNPPSTPCLGFSGGSLTPVSECFTPDDSGSVFSDWEPIDDGKSFFETFVDLVPGESKTYTEDTENAFKRSSATAEELPKAVEGRSKPVTVRQPVGAVEPIAKVAPACFRINAVAPEGHVFYFAYDADLNAQRFSTLISRAVTDKRWGLLFGFQLIFNKQGLDAEAGTFANIEANPYSSTEGAVYTLSHNELILVDAHHGYPEHYVRMIVPVWMCNSSDPAQYNIAQYCIPAVAYIAQNTWTCTEQSLPASSKEYSLRQMLHGADQLSNGYKQHLESMLQECCC